MNEAVIVAAVRTPIGAFGGSLKELTAVDLGVTAARALYTRAGVSPELTDEVLIGCVLDAGLGQNVARQISVGAGCPVTVPAMTVNKVCGSGLRAITLAAQIIRAGDADVVLAGGTENMSRAPFLDTHSRWGARMGSYQTLDSMITDGLWDVFNDYHMGITAENVAAQWQISREVQDQFAAESHRKATAAREAGLFHEEIVPVSWKDRKGQQQMTAADEHIRPETTVASLSRLRPAFVPEGTVSAGNSSGINDGAAMVLVMSARRAAELGCAPLAHIRSFASGGTDPKVMGMAPVPAIQSVLGKASCSVEEIELWELNEAFAAQAIGVAREVGIPAERLNVNGGALALGHPIGASGTRIVVTLIHEMVRRGSARGLAALCIGGGQSDAILLERR